MKPVSVLLIEDSLLFRYALEAVLRRVGCGVTTATSREASSYAERARGVVLLDTVTFPGRNEEIAALVRKLGRLNPVVLLGREDRLEPVLVGLKAGAAGCINQTATPKELHHALLAAAAGGTWCDRTLFRKILRALPGFTTAGQRRLTRRQEQVLHHLVRGETNREIAQALGLTEQAVKLHVSNLLRKTGTTNRTKLSLYAIQQGLEHA